MSQEFLNRAMLYIAVRDDDTEMQIRDGLPDGPRAAKLFGLRGFDREEVLPLSSMGEGTFIVSPAHRMFAVRLGDRKCSIGVEDGSSMLLGISRNATLLASLVLDNKAFSFGVSANSIFVEDAETQGKDDFWFSTAINGDGTVGFGPLLANWARNIEIYGTLEGAAGPGIATMPKSKSLGRYAAMFEHLFCEGTQQRLLSIPAGTLCTVL